MKSYPSLTVNHDGGGRMEWEGYAVSLERSPNTGDVVVRIEAPEDFADSVTIYLNDTEVFD